MWRDLLEGLAHVTHLAGGVGRLETLEAPVFQLEPKG